MVLICLLTQVMVYCVVCAHMLQEIICILRVKCIGCCILGLLIFLLILIVVWTVCNSVPWPGSLATVILASDWKDSEDNNSFLFCLFPVEEEDLFQCGRCKKQFTSLQMFIAHKQTQCVATAPATALPQTAQLQLPLLDDQQHQHQQLTVQQQQHHQQSLQQLQQVLCCDFCFITFGSSLLLWLPLFWQVNGLLVSSFLEKYTDFCLDFAEMRSTFITISQFYLFACKKKKGFLSDCLLFKIFFTTFLEKNLRHWYCWWWWWSGLVQNTSSIDWGKRD